MNIIAIFIIRDEYSLQCYNIYSNMTITSFDVKVLYTAAQL